MLRSLNTLAKLQMIEIKTPLLISGPQSPYRDVHLRVRMCTHGWLVSCIRLALPHVTVTWARDKMIEQLIIHGQCQQHQYGDNELVGN